MPAKWKGGFHVPYGFNFQCSRIQVESITLQKSERDSKNNAQHHLCRLLKQPLQFPQFAQFFLTQNLFSSNRSTLYTNHLNKSHCSLADTGEGLCTFSNCSFFISERDEIIGLHCVLTKKAKSVQSQKHLNARSR